MKYSRARRCWLAVSLIGLVACEKNQDGSNASADLAAADQGSRPETCYLEAHPSLVPSGGTIAPSGAGSALRLSFVYQGSRIGVVEATAVTMVLRPPSNPLTPGVDAAYWVELRDASGRALDTRRFQDPTAVEVPPGPPGTDAGFEHGVRPLCSEKAFNVDLLNDPAGRMLVLFGSPYGTSDPARELARFHLP